MKKRKIDNRMIKSSDELYKEKGKKNSRNMTRNSKNV